jgi:hypothetical protein
LQISNIKKPRQPKFLRYLHLLVLNLFWTYNLSTLKSLMSRKFTMVWNFASLNWSELKTMELFRFLTTLPTKVSSFTKRIRADGCHRTGWLLGVNRFSQLNVTKKLMLAFFHSFHQFCINCLQYRFSLYKKTLSLLPALIVYNCSNPEDLFLFSMV